MDRTPPLLRHTLRVRWRKTCVKMQHGLCALCGLPMGDDVTLDHVVPLSKGGQERKTNVQAVHFECNQKKGNKHGITDDATASRHTRASAERGMGGG